MVHQLSRIILFVICQRSDFHGALHLLGLMKSGPETECEAALVALILKLMNHVN
jgi:hypothetical protein